MKYLFFHPINNTNGYAVEKMNRDFAVVFVERRSKDGKDDLVKVGIAHSNGKMLVYSSPFIADHVIRTEILPLYKKEVA